MGVVDTTSPRRQPTSGQIGPEFRDFRAEDDCSAHLSLLKKPEVAVEMMDRRVHSSWSAYSLSTSSCAPTPPHRLVAA